MKFTNGYWLLRDEMKAAYAVEYGSHRVYGQELTMYLPCSHIVDRGSCLNIPLLTVTLSSPMDGVIKVSAVEPHAASGYPTTNLHHAPRLPNSRYQAHSPRLPT